MLPFSLSTPGRCGLLPLAIPALVLLGIRLGALAFPARNREATAADRAVSGALLAVALVILGTRLFGLLHLLSTAPLFAALVISTLAAARFRRHDRFDFPWRESLRATRTPLFLAGLIALATALVAAWLLPVWQWDSLGYHLPYVSFALQAHATSGVPDGAPYISTYPHAIELFTITLRAMLPDDRLVDLAQFPFAILGAIATAGLARKAGASRKAALGAGAAWLVVPAVFLQIPTDYVDIGAASLLLCAIYFLLPSLHSDRKQTRAGLLCCVLALGLYAGSKPNAPLIAALLSLALFRIHWRTNQFPLLCFALLGAACFAGETFVATAIHHGNPLWPARVNLGPLHLPGRNDLREILESGAGAPHLRGPLWARVAESWTSLTAPPICDMRYGGMGPIFLAAIVPALITLWRRRSWIAWLAVIAAVFAPDPSVVRYVLALPALVFAFAAPRADAPWERPGARWYGAVLSLLLAIAAAWQLVYAFPGLTGEGPSISKYLSMTEAERIAAVGADGRPDAYLALRARIRGDESFAFDSKFDLAYLAWESAPRYAVFFISDELRDAVDVGAFLDQHRVRALAVGDAGLVHDWLASHPGVFTKLFSSKSEPFSVYERVLPLR